MTKEIRRYELALDTDDEEAGLMKARMRVEEAQRIRRRNRDQEPMRHPTAGRQNQPELR